MATAEKGKTPPAEEERKFPLWPLIGAVAAFLTQRISTRPEFNMWLYGLAVGLVGIASLYHLAPRKNGKVVVTPFNLDVYGPVGVALVITWLSVQIPIRPGQKEPADADRLQYGIGAGIVALVLWYLWRSSQRGADGKVGATEVRTMTGIAAAIAAAVIFSTGYIKDDNTASVASLSLSVGGFAVIAWGYWLAAQSRAREFQLLRDRLLVVIGCAAGIGYANYGHLHFDNFIHTWDTYHYYVGAKYFNEIGYDRMYECAIIADSEDFPADKLQKMREQRIVTNLRTNIMEKVGETVLLRPQDCKSHFSPDRWQAFKKDIAFFRARVNDKRWEEIHHDHGYNASPVWTLLGYVITNTGPATLDQVVFVDLFDPVYLALMAAMIWWAFGPRVFAVAMLMLGCNWASRFFYWTGGALLRHDWLFYTVAVVCLLKKGKPFLAGIALSYAALLRLFPGLLVVGPMLAAVEYARLKIKVGSTPAPRPTGRGLPIAGVSIAVSGLAIALWAVLSPVPRPENPMRTRGVTAQCEPVWQDTATGRQLVRSANKAALTCEWTTAANVKQRNVFIVPFDVDLLQKDLLAEKKTEVIEKQLKDKLAITYVADNPSASVLGPLPPEPFASPFTPHLLIGLGLIALGVWLVTRWQKGTANVALIDAPLEEEPARVGLDAKLPRWVDPAFARFVAGGLLATTLLAGASFAAFGGVDTWKRFAANTAKHAATPLTNHMGLRTVISYTPWTTGQWTRDSKQLDAWQPWKTTRTEVFAHSRIFFIFAALAGAVLLYFAVRGTRANLWASAALGAGYIAVGAELTNYYYVFFVALAALCELRREVGMFLCAMVATCIFIMLTPILGMSGWQDEQSVAMSIVSLIAVGGIWWIFTPWGKRFAVEPEPLPVVLAEPLPVPVAAAAGGKKKKR